MDTIKKLVNTSSLPRYKENVVTTPEVQWTLEMILRWGSYLAKNLDFKPEQIISTKYIPLMACSLHYKEELTVDEVAKMLEAYRVPDKVFHSAKLLLAYLERSGETISKMKGVICRACNQTGHVVST